MSLLGGIFGMIGAKRDAKNSRANMHVQQGMTLQQMRLARKWQNQDNRRSKRQQMRYFQDTRKAAESAGYNPASVLGMLPGSGGAGAMGSPGGPSPVMSSANADAFMMMGNAFGETIDQAAQNQALLSQNQQMNETIRNLTLRPKVDGIYAQRERTPSLASAMGYQDGPVDTGQSGGSSAHHPSGDPDAVRLFGVTLPTDDNFSKAQKSEDFYGELVGDATGYWKFMNDTGNFLNPYVGAPLHRYLNGVIPDYGDDPNREVSFVRDKRRREREYQDEMRRGNTWRSVRHAGPLGSFR